MGGHSTGVNDAWVEEGTERSFSGGLSLPWHGFHEGAAEHAPPPHLTQDPLMDDRTMSRSRRILITIVFACLCAAGVVGQVTITGNISDGAGGPLLSGVVYHATGNLTVPAGATLTIQAGAIVKFNFDRQMTVNGQLDVLGTMAMPVILTDIQDDTAGGDTNGNGPSMGAPNSWRTLQFNATATGTVSHLTLRFAGRFGFGGMEISGAAIAFDHCTVSDCSSAGLDLNNIATSSTFTSCNFTNNNRAVEGVRLESVPNFTSNTASGNAQHDSLSVASGAINSGATTITAANMISNVIICPNITVAAGASLTLDQGCILKMNFDRQVIITGTLNCSGTSGAPVIFTSLTDDAAGGDTNKDGMSSTPGPDYWRNLNLPSSSAGSLLVQAPRSDTRGGSALPGCRQTTTSSCGPASCDPARPTGSPCPAALDPSSKIASWMRAARSPMPIARGAPFPVSPTIRPSTTVGTTSA